MKIRFLITSVSLIFLLSGCAGPYHSTDPSLYKYKTLHKTEKLEYYLISDVLKKAGNFRYAKKEKKHDLSMVAVKIKNISDSAITFSEETLNIQSGGNNFQIIAPNDFYHKTKRQSGYYLLWALLWITYTTLETSNYPYAPTIDYHYIPVGIPIAILNILIAENANKNFHKDLLKYSLLKRTLNPGEEIYGYLFLDISNNHSLEIQIK